MIETLTLMMPESEILDALHAKIEAGGYKVLRRGTLEFTDMPKADAADSTDVDHTVNLVGVVVERVKRRRKASEASEAPATQGEVGDAS